MNLENIFCTMPLGVGISCKVSGLWDMEEQRGLATKWVKPQRKGIFMGGGGGGGGGGGA